MVRKLLRIGAISIPINPNIGSMIEQSRIPRTYQQTCHSLQISDASSEKEPPSTSTIALLPAPAALQISCSRRLQSSKLIPMIPIATKQLLALHTPSMLLVQPVATEELPDTGIVWFLLGRLERDKPIEVLIDEGGFAGASTCRVGRAMPVSCPIC